MIEDRIKIDAFYDELNKIASKNEVKVKSDLPWGISRGLTSGASGYVFLRAIEPLLKKTQKPLPTGGRIVREIARTKRLLPLALLLAGAGAVEGLLESRIEKRVEQKLR